MTGVEVVVVAGLVIFAAFPIAWFAALLFVGRRHD